MSRTPLVGSVLLLVASFAFADDVPPADRLSAAGLYQNLAEKKIAPENQPYSTQYPLWSDGAEKSRWVYLPPGTKIATGKKGSSSAAKGNMDYWLFPVGTRFWKEFVFATPEGKSRRVETRLAEKRSDGQWRFVTYEWNADESEAFLVPQEGKRNALAIDGGVTHDIPSEGSCHSCHNRGGDPVLGFDALGLSGESREGWVSFASLVREGKLSYVPEGMTEAKVHARDERETKALGYLHTNCGGCHNPKGTAAHSWIVLRQSSMLKPGTPSPVLSSIVDQPTSRISVPDQEETLIVQPGVPEKSGLVIAMKRTGAVTMPPRGSKLVDREAVTKIEEWIRSLPSSAVE